MSNAFLSAANTTIKIDTTAIGDLDQIGTFGGQAQVIKHTPINDGVVYKKLGSRDNGTLQLQGAYVPGDAGQTALKAAFDGRTTNTYVIELDNAVTPSTGNGTQFSFDAVVTSFQVGTSGADNKVQLTSTLEITGAITLTAAT